MTQEDVKNFVQKSSAKPKPERFLEESFAEKTTFFFMKLPWQVCPKSIDQALVNGYGGVRALHFLSPTESNYKTWKEYVNQMMASFILSGIPPTGNQTTISSWTFRNAFITSVIIVSTIGYGTVFPRTTGGQMFCVVFAAIGIPVTIIVFKNFSKLVFLPFEKLGSYLESKGVSKKNAYLWKIVLFVMSGSLLFLVLPPFVFMSLENWTYIEGIYYSFATISAIGLGDYTIASNPMKETKSITYSILLLIWILHGLVWIALLFNLITQLLYEVELKLSKETSETEVGKKERKTEDRRHAEKQYAQ